MKTSLAKYLLAGSLFLAPALASAATLVPWVDDGVSWQNYYNPSSDTDATQYDKLPNDTGTSPQWASGSSAGTTVSRTLMTEAGVDFFRLGTPSQADIQTYKQTTGYGLGVTASDATVEVRFRASSLNVGNLYSGHFFFSTAGSTGRWTEVLYSPTSLRIGSTNYTIGLADWTTLRFTISNAISLDPENPIYPILSVYVNGSTTALATVIFPNTGNSAHFQFGDPSATAGYSGGTTDIDYIRWTNAGAFAPVPEPAALLSVAMGGLLLIGLGRRRGKNA